MTGRRSWTDGVSAELVDCFRRGEAGLARSGLRIDVLQASWREQPNGHRPGFFDLFWVRLLLRFLGTELPEMSPGLLVIVRVTPGPDGRPCVEVTRTPAVAADLDPRPAPAS